jgi:hypothetical protein
MTITPQQAADLAYECLCTPLKVALCASNLDRCQYASTTVDSVAKVLDELLAVLNHDTTECLRFARSMEVLDSCSRNDAPESVEVKQINSIEDFVHFLCFAELAYAIVHSRIVAICESNEEVRYARKYLSESNANYTLKDLGRRLDSVLSVYRNQWYHVNRSEFRVKLKREIALMESSMESRVSGESETEQHRAKSIGTQLWGNQDDSETRKQKIREALKALPKTRGQERTALQKKISRWKNEWSAEYAAVIAESSSL